MKRFILLLITGIIVNWVIAQNETSLEKKLAAIENQDSTPRKTTDTIKVAEKRAKGDTTLIRLGKKSVKIIDDDSKTTLVFPNKNEEKWDIEYHHKPEFKGHWAGFEMGINGFMDKNHSLIQQGELAPYDLKQARSWNVNINFAQYSAGFGTDKVGLVTGMGFEFNDYHFSNPITLKVQNGITMIDSSYINNQVKVNKTKLSTVFLTLPMLLEFQIPTYNDDHRLYFAAGVIGGLRLGSHTKVVYEDNGTKKDKNRDDFNIATLRYGLTARLGYRGIRLFANYYPVQLFEKRKGAELYPFSVGLVLIPFRD